MALDKLVDSSQLNADLTSIANAIRTKGGTSAQLAFPAGFVSAVQAIPSGGGGMTVEPKTVSFQNGRTSGSIILTRVTCDAYTTGFGIGAATGSVTVNNTISVKMALFNGDTIVFHSNPKVTSIKYNGEDVAFTISGSSAQWDCHLTLPSGYDNSYPFVLS